jgi:hypothetical protein
MRDGHLEASGRNWVEGQGSGPRLGKNDGEDDDRYDAMGNKIDSKKNKKLTAGEARKVCFALLMIVFCLRGLLYLLRLRRSGWRARKRARLSATTSLECDFFIYINNRVDRIRYIYFICLAVIENRLTVTHPLFVTGVTVPGRSSALCRFNFDDLAEFLSRHNAISTFEVVTVTPPRAISQVVYQLPITTLPALVSLKAIPNNINRLLAHFRN